MTVRTAFLPLGFVGREHADGHLLGAAVAVPQDFPTADADLLFELLARHGESEDVVAVGVPYLELHVKNAALGNQPVGTMILELDERPFGQRPTTLRPETWTGPARHWATVTPVSLPLFPRRKLSAEDVVIRACTDAGYPSPASVQTGSAPMLAGVPHLRSVYVKPVSGRPRRRLIHAFLRFDAPIRGPVLIGSGRYAGFGVCRPVREEEAP